MTKQVQRRRGTATQHTSFTGAEGELSVNTTNKSVHVHDNVTAGGFEAARVDMDNVTSSSILTAAGITATTTELNYVDGVTSAIQTQIDGKAGTASPTFTGTLAAAAITSTGVGVTGNITVSGTVDGRDIAADGTKLDGIEASADVTDLANVTAAGALMATGGSVTGDISFGDNDKAIFGAGSDLQIYHDGSGSYIRENGTGDLLIQASNIQLEDPDGNNYLRGVDGGILQLYHSGAEVLRTASTGIDVTGTVTMDGGSTSADFSFGDNAKAIFGAGSDLTISHDTTGTVGSYITEAGTGSLNIRGQNIIFAKADGSEEYGKFFNGAGVEFNFADATKFATTSTGVDITGVLTSDGLTVDGAGTAITLQSNNNAGTALNTLRFTDTDTSAQIGQELGKIEFYSSDTNSDAVVASITGKAADASPSGSLLFSTADDAVTLTQRMLIDETGDISFFEDTGTTAKFFWSATDERLGIGSSPATALDVLSASASVGALKVKNASGASASIPILEAINGGGNTRLIVLNDGSTGIGTNSPSHLLDVEGSVDVVARIGATGSGDADAALYIDGSDTGESFIRFDTDGTEGARITMTGGAGGNFNIQTAASSGRAIDFEPNDTLTMQVVTPAGGTSTTGILEFFADGTSAGKISAMDADLVIGEDAVGIKFENTGTDRIIPVNVDTLATRSAAIDLGGSSERFKDLYLSGGVYLGGTGSANYLDDYEFGFFAPTFTSSGTNPSGITYDPTVGNEGRYTKIGGVVHIQINIRTDEITNKGTGNLHISGLPFASGSYSSQGGYSVFTCQAAAFLNNQPSAAQIGENSTELGILYRSAIDDDVISLPTSSLNTGSNDNLIRISGTYMTEE